MSFLKDQRERNQARKNSRLWAAGAGGRTGLVAPIGSGTRQGGSGRPTVEANNLGAVDPVQAVIDLSDGGVPNVPGPPSTPAAPEVVAGNPLRIQVTHNLGSQGGTDFDLEVDLDHLEVHVGTADAFTVSISTLVGTLTANAGMLAVEVPAIGSFDAPGVERWIRVVAVDIEGNQSGPSTAVAVTADLISESFIESLSADKITAGTIDANEVSIANLTVSTAQVTGTFTANKISGGTISGVTFSAGATTIDTNGITMGIGTSGSSSLKWDDGSGLYSSGSGLFMFAGSTTNPFPVYVYGAMYRRNSFGTNYLYFNELNHDHNTGTLTTNGISWLGAAFGTNGNSGNSDGTVGFHSHAVPFHTHTVSV